MERYRLLKVVRRKGCRNEYLMHSREILGMPEDDQ